MQISQGNHSLISLHFSEIRYERNSTVEYYFTQPRSIHTKVNKLKKQLSKCWKKDNEVTQL